MKTLGIIINPLAGIGGSVGLKGSDGIEIQKKALSMGAAPQAGKRALLALEKLAPYRESFRLLTWGGEMGEQVARSCNLEPVVLGQVDSGRTTSEDTIRAAREMLHRGVDLLLFAGGDGTARDIYQAVGLDLPVTGIPAGVKIHSAVYAASPVAAGYAALEVLQGRPVQWREAEVMDIDEEGVRQGRVTARLYGYLKVPSNSRLMQSLKVASSGESQSLSAIAADIVDHHLQEGLYFFIGPGTTTRAIADLLELPKTLIGVDVLYNRQWAVMDVSEAQLLEFLQHGPAKIVVTPIGGQGYLFGRGNQQLSPQVIQQVGRENILVVSTPEKLYSLSGSPFLVDTGDPHTDRRLSGFVRVILGYNEMAVYPVVSIIE